MSPFGVILDLPNELNRFRLVAPLARVINRDDRLDRDRDHILLGLNEPCPLDPFSGMRMALASIKEVNSHQFGDATLTQIRPNSLEFSAIGQ